MIKKVFLLALTGLALAGCAKPVKSTLFGQYGQANPYAIAVMPIVMEEGGDREDAEIRDFFRLTAAEKLKSMNYGPVALAEVDRNYSRLGAAWFASSTPQAAARAMNADAVLYIYIIEWDKNMFATYASLKVKASFELYSSNGTRLWSSEYQTREADLRLDTESMELAVIKAYEPRVQRFVDIAFSTLPQAQPQKKAQTFFQWLP